MYNDLPTNTEQEDEVTRIWLPVLYEDKCLTVKLGRTTVALLLLCALPHFGRSMD